MPGTTAKPFSSEPLATIALHPPLPLVRVLTQVRFVPVFDAASEGQVGRFQRALVARYPRASEDVELAIALGLDPSKPPSATPKNLWRFSDLEGAWRVSLTTDFVTLETSRYEGHQDFFARLNEVVAAVQDHLAPPLVTRVGVRYVQRMDGPADLGQLRELIRPEVLGISALAGDDAEVRLDLTTAQFGLNGGVVMLGKWGVVPEGFMLDLDVAPVPKSSWLLDLDTFDEAQGPFEATEINERALDYSRRQYRFFRWAVEPAFLRRFGAQEEQVVQALAEMEAS